MGGSGILATEAGGHLDLIGELRGYAVVVFSVGLFCGSIYMVLATDVGSGMGFLVSFATLAASCHARAHLVHQPHSTQRPPRARPALEGVRGGRDLGEAKIEEARHIARRHGGDAAAQGEIKATVDAGADHRGRRVQQFSNASDYVCSRPMRSVAAAWPSSAIARISRS